MPLQRHSSHSGSGWLHAPTASMPPPLPPAAREHGGRRVRLPACSSAPLHGLALGRCGRGLAFFF